MSDEFDLRGSSMPLFHACAQSARRPKGEPLIDQHNPDGAVGTAAHSALRMVLGEGQEPDLVIPALCQMHGCEPDEVSPLVYGGLSLWSKVREHFKEPKFEAHLHGDTLLGPVGCTLDIASFDSWNFLDWKTGGKDGNYYHQMAAYANAMLTTAVAVDRGIEQITAVVAYVRLGFYDVHVFTRPMLAEWGANLALYAQNAGETYSPGEHCQFCRRQFSCKAREEWIASTMRALAIPGGNFIVERKDSPELVRRIGAARKLLDGLHASIKADVEANGPVDAGDGKVLGIKIKKMREVVDVEETRTLLAGYIGEDKAEECFELSLTLADKAIMAATPVGRKAKVRDEWKEASIKNRWVGVIEQRELRIFNPTEKGEEE